MVYGEGSVKTALNNALRAKEGGRIAAAPMIMIPIEGSDHLDRSLEVKLEEGDEERLQLTGAYCAREAALKAEVGGKLTTVNAGRGTDSGLEGLQEDAGRLKFECHSNDGVEEHMIWYPSTLPPRFTKAVPELMEFGWSGPGWLV